MRTMQQGLRATIQRARSRGVVTPEVVAAFAISGEFARLRAANVKHDAAS